MNNKWLVKLFLFFLASFFLSACVNRSTVDNNISWEKEVKEAVACGLDGLQCCLEEDPPCRYGQKCCFSQSDPNDHFCSDDCSCGDKGKFCCPGEVCAFGLVCRKNRCWQCGGENEPCCQQETCKADLVCHNGFCRQCGLAGQPCCQTIPVCKAEEKNGARNECVDGVCRLCGIDNTFSCLEGEPCNKDHLFNNGFCFACGRFNQPCCEENVSGYECQKDENLICQLGFCAKSN